MTDGSYYLLDNIIEFHHEEHYLFSRNDQQSVSLQIPASLCLLALLKKHGEVIPQAELLMAGWGERSGVVAANTFYQTILNLRRSLESAGLNKEFVITINRRGLVIPEKWPVSYHAHESKPYLCVSEKKKHSSLNLPGVPVIACSLLIILAGVFAYISLTSPLMPFNDYRPLKSADMPKECEIFTYKGKGGHSPNVLAEVQGLCKVYSVIYLSTSETMSKFSILACNGVIYSSHDPECKLFYFPGGGMKDEKE